MAEEQVLNTHNASILLSAANKSHYPKMICQKLPLLDVQMLVNQVLLIPYWGAKFGKNLKQARKNPTIKFFNIDNKLRFVDVPGYGYAKVSKSERAKWGKMIEEYLTSRDNLRAVVSLVDLRHAPSKKIFRCMTFEVL